jgi:hypothetical protein
MATVELRCTYDTRHRENFATTNFGEERFLTVQSGAGSAAQASYLSFAGLPELGATIVSATLRVWAKGTAWTTGTPHDITCRVILERWKESQLTFNNKPDTSTGGNEITQSVPSTADGVSIDIPITSLMSSVMAGSLDYFGLRLGTTTGSTQRQLYSSEATDPDFRPLLIIEYKTTPDAPTDVSPSGGKAVSLQKPVFGWQSVDADGDPQTAFQIQIEDNGTVQADGSFASPEYDSGWIASTSEEFDSNLSGTGGALPTFVAAGTVASGTGNITPGLPAGVTLGDHLWLAVESEATNPPPATPDGYQIVSASVVGGNTRLTVFWRRATSVEAAPTVTDVGDHLLARMVATRGGTLTGNPWEFATSSTDTSDTSGSMTGGTTTSANCLILGFATSDFDPGSDDTAGYSGLTNASLASLTERTDNRAAAGSGGTLMIFTGTKAAAGATGATTYTLANAGTKAHLVLALQPTGSYGSTWAGITAGNTRWWVVRTRNGGQDSPWSDVTSFTRTAKGSLTISSPTNGGWVEETTPPVISSLSVAQENIAYILEEQQTDLSWKEVWEQGKRSALATAGSNYSFSVPSGKITKNSTNYRITVRSWDSVDRDATPGDPLYVQTQSTFTFVNSATPSAVTSLSAAQEANSGPGVVLTWNRAAGQPSPDYFALKVNSVRVLDRIEPASVIVGGDPIVFTMIYYGAEPFDTTTYEIEAVTLSSGALKHSQSNDTEVFNSLPAGAWLLDDADPPYTSSNPPRKVLIRTASVSLGIGESGTTFRPVGRRDPVTVVDAIGGYEGTVAGVIWGTDPVFGTAGYVSNFRWMKSPANIGRRFRFIGSGLSIPVELGVVDSFSPKGDVGQKRAYDVSFNIVQVDEFREAE